MNREEAQQRSEEALQELIHALEQGRSETLIKYLETLARFHHYSFGNTILIAIQRPDATHVAGFHRWRQLGRVVKKGEHGIAILAPLVYKQAASEPAVAAADQENSSVTVCEDSKLCTCSTCRRPKAKNYPNSPPSWANRVSNWNVSNGSLPKRASN
ncbi:MAG TPA: ArdC family protein [Pirellulales bacterium]|nr:ArdC family protein [Pirellulales bacterium]